MRTYTLKVDVDVKMEGWVYNNWIDTRLLMLRELGKKMKFKVVDIVLTDTKRGHHAYIKISTKNELRPEIINWLQFLCGDDQSRVKINMERIKRGVKHWNKLFERVTYRRRKERVKCPVCGYKFAVGWKK